jgi:pyrroloquinoline-quinone synthase
VDPVIAGASSFVEDLRRTIDARRTFGRHPLWLRIQEGRLGAADLRTFAVQFFLQVREFPRAVSALHARCPFSDERIRLAESLYEEETGRISGCNVSHPELFIRFGEAVGAPRSAMVDGEPLPGTAALIDWFELSTTQRSFIEGAAATNLAAEGQVPGAFAPLARALEIHYGLTREQVAFWDIHEEADREHSDIGDHVVIRFATTSEWQAKVRLAVERSLALWWQFFDDVGRAIDAGPGPAPAATADGSIARSSRRATGRGRQTADLRVGRKARSSKS